MRNKHDKRHGSCLEGKAKMVLRSCEGADDGYKAIIGRQDIDNNFTTCSSPP